MSFLQDIGRIGAGGMMSHPARHWRSAARRFVHWWLTELVGMVPSFITGRLLGQGTVLPVRLDGDLLHIEGVAPLALDGARLPAPVAARLAQADAVVLVLPATMVLRRTIELPAAASRELASAVPFLIERHTPFLPDRARAAWRIVGRDAGRGKITLELAVTPEAPLGRILARLHAFGVPSGAIHVNGDDRLPRLDFAGTHRRPPVRSWLAEPWRPLLAAAVVLLLAGPAVVAAVVHLRASSLAQSLASHEARPLERQQLQTRLQHDLALAATLAMRTSQPDALLALQNVTQALPDSSWLFSFDLAGQTLQLGGFSTDMPAAVVRLQAIPGVEHLEFRSAVIHDARADRDRFDILLRFAKAGHAERVPP